MQSDEQIAKIMHDMSDDDGCDVPWGKQLPRFRSQQRRQVRKVLLALTAAGYRILGPDELAVKARPLDEWHEDHGDVVWWCWRDGAWLGEPAYIGSPLDMGQTVECHTHAMNGETPAARFLVGGWPGYHTHWTPHPDFPAAPTATGGR